MQGQFLLQLAKRFIETGPKMLTKSTSCTVVDGKSVASSILGDKVKEDIAKLSQAGIIPHLKAIVVGEVPESKVYVERKRVAAEKLGVRCSVVNLPSSISEKSLIDIVQESNTDPGVHGLIIQLPLPSHINETIVCNAVSFSKDVDGFSSYNLGRLVQGSLNKKGMFVPCTALAVAEIIKTTFPGPTKGLRAVVAGRSHNVGFPIALILSSDQCKGGLDLSTTVCHRYTPPEDLAEAVQRADIVVSAAGVPGLIKGEFVKPGAFVVDVGITRVCDENGSTKIVGDVAPSVSEVAGFVTPVPGGVGPCTVACLLANTVKAAVWSTSSLKEGLRI